MRIMIFTILGMFVSVISYNLLSMKDPSRITQLHDSEASTVLNPTTLSEDELTILTNKLEEYQRKFHEQLQETQLQQALFGELLESIDARILSIEQEANAEVIPTTELNPVYDTPKPPQVTDADITHWIDESLHVGYQDDNLTSLATDQVIENLEKAPGVSLDDMLCADRFCRATFSHVNGEQPVIDNLFGEPPFVNEGITIVQPDGRVTLYFNRPGESLAELRNEVASSLGYRDSASEEAIEW